MLEEAVNAVWPTLEPMILPNDIKCLISLPGDTIGDFLMLQTFGFFACTSSFIDALKFTKVDLKLSYGFC